MSEQNKVVYPVTLPSLVAWGFGTVAMIISATMSSVLTHSYLDGIMSQDWLTHLLLGGGVAVEWISIVYHIVVPLLMRRVSRPLLYFTIPNVLMLLLPIAIASGHAIAYYDAGQCDALVPDVGDLVKRTSKNNKNKPKVPKTKSKKKATRGQKTTTCNLWQAIMIINVIATISYFVFYTIGYYQYVKQKKEIQNNENRNGGIRETEEA